MGNNRTDLVRQLLVLGGHDGDGRTITTYERGKGGGRRAPQCTFAGLHRQLSHGLHHRHRTTALHTQGAALPACGDHVGPVPESRGRVLRLTLLVGTAAGRTLIGMGALPRW